MGLTGWQQNLTVSEQIAQNIAQQGGVQQQQNLSAFVLGLGVLAIIALGIAAPELIPFLAADAATDAGAGVASGAAVDAAVEEPGYITWAKSVVADPSGYSEDSFEKAESILYRNKML